MVARAWWPERALDVVSSPNEESSLRKVLASRVREEKRCEALLVAVGGTGTVAAQQELLAAGMYTYRHVQCLALGRAAGGDQPLTLGYFARCVSRRMVQRDAARRWRALLATSADLECDGEVQASRLALGALLVERFAKHGAAAMDGNIGVAIGAKGI